MIKAVRSKSERNVTLRILLHQYHRLWCWRMDRMLEAKGFGSRRRQYSFTYWQILHPLVTPTVHSCTTAGELADLTVEPFTAKLLSACQRGHVRPSDPARPPTRPPACNNSAMDACTGIFIHFVILEFILKHVKRTEAWPKMDNVSLFYYRIELWIIYIFSNLYQLDQNNSHIILSSNWLKILHLFHKTYFRYSNYQVL